MILGIDASNIRAGGGVTHLLELLRHAKPQDHGFERVIVWAGAKTLERLEDRSWLQKTHVPLLDGSLLQRSFWQQARLDSAVRQAQCDLLFVPGGSYGGTFRPYVTMSRNLLPFALREIARYGLSVEVLRLHLLRYLQRRTFRRADGVIFLSAYARQVVQERLKGALRRSVIIPHGVSSTFRVSPRPQLPMSSYSFSKPLRCLYVSSITVYKHQWHVVQAIADLRQQGYPVTLDLVGVVSTKMGGRRLEETLQRIDPSREFVNVIGFVPHAELDTYHRRADCFVFASTCETFGQVVTEAVSAGLPVACSQEGPMMEILGESAVYFAPEEPQSIAAALKTLLDDPALRLSNAQQAYAKVVGYTWERCAESTFSFLADILEHRGV